MPRALCLFLLLIGLASPAFARNCTGPAGICAHSSRNGIALISGGRPLPVIADGPIDAGAMRALRDLQTDLGRVAGRKPELLSGPSARAPVAVIVGTLGNSAIIDRLVRQRRLDVSGVAGHWEAYLQQVVRHPAPGIGEALVIAGSDKRGTIFGAYDLSRRIGVSPWVWWADVPVRRAANLWVLPGRRVQSPAVRYRGFFINDEDPALGGWARQTFGGLNHKFYAHVFELVLRMRGNLLWPAMWGKSFDEDDPENARLAN